MLVLFFNHFIGLPRSTALDNVMLPLEILAGDPYSMDKAQEALEKVGLSKREKHLLLNLVVVKSNARCYCKITIVNKPKFYLLMSQYGNLDKKSSDSISDLLFSLK